LYDEAISMSDEAKQISQEIDNPWGIVYSRFYVGFVFEDRGQMEKAIRDYEIIHRMGKDAEFLIGEYWGIARLVHIYTELNALDQSGYYIAQAAADIINYNGLLGLYASMITLEKVSLLLAQGDIHKAARLFLSSNFEGALAIALTQNYVREVHIRVLLAQGEDEEALQYNEEYIADLNASKNKSYLHQMLLFKGIAHHRMNRYDQAEAALNDALTIAQDLGARWRLWQILSRLADVEDKLNNSSKAASLRNKAVEYVDSICAEISRPELRESFLNRLDVKELMSDR
jgi:tetratricopeptide (TPR) repeat protein